MSNEYPKITKAEVDFLNKAICPDCKKDELYVGPRGGMMINIRCHNCGSRFNIPDPEIPMPFDEHFFERLSSKSPNFPPVIKEYLAAKNKS